MPPELAATYSLTGAAVFAVLFYACRPLFVRAWTQGLYAGIEGYVTYPTWPVFLILLIGCVCSGLQFLIFAAGEARLALLGPPPTQRARADREGEA